MPFEVFTNATSAERGTPTVRFLSNGRVHFNAAATRLFDGASYLRILFDSETSRVGFEVTDTDDPNGFKLTKQDSQSVLTASAFVQRYDVPSEQRLPLTEEDGILVADLPQKAGDAGDGEKRS